MANGKIGQPSPITADLAGAKNPSGLIEPLLVDSSGNLLISGTIVASNPSVGSNGSPIPLDSTLFGGSNPSGNLTPISVDASGNENVNVVSNVLPTGAATSALQTTGNTSLASIVENQTNGTQETQITGTVPLPTGAATSALQTTGNTSLASIDSKTPALGQALAAASQPVVLTAIQISTLTPLSTVTANQGTAGGTAWPVSAVQSGTWNIINISGTISLPTGAATSALQTTGNTSLASIDSKTPAQGSATSANSSPIVIASDQSAVPIKSGNGSLTDNSGSTSGTPSTSTTVMATNASRKYLLIQNDSTTATIWINFTSAASAGSGSYMLLPGGSLVQETGFVSTELVTVLSTTASVPYTAKQA